MRSGGQRLTVGCMFARLRSGASYANVAATAALVLAAGGAAWAAIPDGAGTIHGCYAGSSGALSVIDEGKSCPQGSSALNWNQTGPQGPAGPPGQPGPKRVGTEQLADGAVTGAKIASRALGRMNAINVKGSTSE